MTGQQTARDPGEQRVRSFPSAYTYFASKSALVAELEVIALQRTLWAFEDVLPRWLDELGSLDDRSDAEARLLALGEFGVRARTPVLRCLKILR